MKAATEKKGTIAVVLLHALLMMDAKITLYHYPDFFINSAFALLVLFLCFVLYGYRHTWIPSGVLILYGFGVGGQILLFFLGDFWGCGFLGLGNLSFGSGVSLLFYGFCLICSYVLLFGIQLIKWSIKKITST